MPDCSNALLRFEEASLALRAALKLQVVDEIGDDDCSLADLRQQFGFTNQASRTYFWLLVAMRILEVHKGRFQVTAVAKRTLASDTRTSRAPYLSMGMDAGVTQLISKLRGETGEVSPLYGEEGGGETLMDLDDVGSTVAHGLASRARNFGRAVSRRNSHGRGESGVGR